jgi:6-phosphogluconolactonase
VASIQIFPDLSDLIDNVAAKIVSVASDVITKRGDFRIMLAGGSTPRLLYERLTEPEFVGRLDWMSVHVYWGDERCVPMDHQDSNHRMARESLLDRAPIPTENIYRIRGELIPQDAADLYEKELSQSFRSEDDRITGAEFPQRDLPIFDLILLGMGGDGHTASLFPGSSALNEKGRWFVAVVHNQPPPPLVPRVTVTPSVINAASNVIFLVTGSSKAKRLAEVLEGAHNPDVLPAQIVNPENGQLYWFVDQEAASELSS